MKLQLGNRVRLSFQAKGGCGGYHECELVIGDEGLVEGLSQALVGRSLGENFELSLGASAFGPGSSGGLQRQVAKARLPELQLLDRIALSMAGQVANFWVVGEEGENWCLDTQHPWAGEAQVFEVEVLALT